MLMKQKSLSSNLDQDHHQQTRSGDSEQDKHFYDKNISFFDRISCEANEKAQSKPKHWKEERKLNAETFGLKENQAQMRSNYNNYNNYNRSRNMNSRPSNNNNNNNNSGNYPMKPNNRNVNNNMVPSQSRYSNNGGNNYNQNGVRSGVPSNRGYGGNGGNNGVGNYANALQQRNGNGSGRRFGSR